MSGMAIEPTSPRTRPDEGPMGTFEALLAMLVVGVVVAIAIGAIL